MGFFGIYNSKEIASDKNLADSDNNGKEVHEMTREKNLVLKWISISA